MSTTITPPITVEQFMKLDLPEGREWELHDGEIVDMGEPSPRHRRLQRQMLHLLERLFPDADVLFEYAFTIPGRKMFRSADIGVTTKERASDNLLEGAPELVAEVLSPSNTALGLKEYRRLCFANGTQIFLTIDSDDHTVQVHLKGEKDGRTFGAGEHISIELFGMTVTLTVDEVFK